MTWITASLIVAAVMALVNVVDSHLIAKRMPNIWTFMLSIGVIHLTFGLITVNVIPLVGEVEAFSWFMAALSAVARSIAAFLMLYSMRSEEVSRVIPVVHTSPVFVAILAVPLLDERLSYLQWLAVVITVAGAVLISLRGQGRSTRLRRSFIMLLASSVFFGLANIATKYASESIGFWNMYSITALCFGVSFLMLSMRPGVRQALRALPDKGTVFSLITCIELLAFGGIVLSFWAIENGPVSLVSTVMGIRPFFVFLFALALSLLLPAVLDERFSRGIVALKVVSIALIIGGVAIINLVD
jgi:drug/metabolite transporter (DMT)-like permease